MSTPFGLEHEREHPVVDRDGNPVTGGDPTLLPRDPDGTEADPAVEAEYRAGGQTPAPPAEPVAEPIILPASPEVPSHRKDTPIDATTDVPRDEPIVLGPSGEQVVLPVTDDVPRDTPSPAPAPARDSGTVTDSTWLELQGRFVDDPQAAVREAADLLDRAIADIRRELESSDSTEDLRNAFRRYRDLYRSLR